MRIIVHSLLLVAISVGLAAVNSSDQQLLLSASDLVNIRAGDAKPFQLEADIRLQFNVPLDGNFTWKWAAKDLWMQEILMGNYSEIRVRKGESLYISRNAPFSPLQIIQLEDLLNVFSVDSDSEIKKVKHEAEEGIQSECMQVQSRSGRPPSHGHTELCINPTTKELISEDIREGPEYRQKQFRDYEPFREHRYPRELKLLVNGSAVVKVWVTSLQSASFDDTTFTAPPRSIVRRQCEHMIPPVPVKTPNPEYPRSVAHKRIGGIVTVAVTVLPDGSTDDVHVVSGASHEIDEVTERAVKSWRFKPAMCGNEPVVDEIHVQVAFGPQ